MIDIATNAMPAARQSKSPEARINIHKTAERARWARRLNVDETLLVEAVQAVGDDAWDVAQYLQLLFFADVPGERPKDSPTTH